MKLVKKGKIYVIGATLMILTIGLSGCLGSLADMVVSVDRRNPTYQEMAEFIQNDYTECGTYSIVGYVCDDFAQDLMTSARAEGYNVGYVTLDASVNHPYYGMLYGHAIVCFDTTDKGLYFVEPQNDVIFSKADMNYMISVNCYTVFGYEYTLGGYEIDWHHTSSRTQIPYWDY